MKTFWFVLLCVGVVVTLILWREAPIDVQVQTRWYLRKHLIVAVLAVIAVCFALLALSSFSIKLF